MSNSARNRVLIIGEVAQAHDGSLGLAHAFIDGIANAGADAVKFQTHIASAESTPEERWRVAFSKQDATRYEYWKRMEFTEEQWDGLKKHASERGLKFLSSPFSVEAADLLQRVGVDAWKIASGEVTNTALFTAIARSGLPVFLSSGMSSLEEIDGAVLQIKSAHLPLTVMQCTSMYPTPAEKVGLNLIPFFRQRYQCDVGLSDHSGTIFPALAATTIGIEILEVHVTLSREMFGPDVPASITTTELRTIVNGIRYIEAMKANPVDKDAVAETLAPMRNLFTKSVVACRDLPAGTVLLESHLTLKKPGTGFPPSSLKNLIGQTLKRPVKADQMLQRADFV